MRFPMPGRRPARIGRTSLGGDHRAETLSVLYLSPFIGLVNGMVFATEPMTDNGGPMPNSGNVALNPVRRSVAPEGLVNPSSGIQALTGDRSKSGRGDRRKIECSESQ